VVHGYNFCFEKLLHSHWGSGFNQKSIYITVTAEYLNFCGFKPQSATVNFVSPPVTVSDDFVAFGLQKCF